VRYLVTGADGFIGSHLCHRLVADGHEVVAFCHYRGDLDLSRLRITNGLTVEWGCVECADTWAQIPREGFDGVFHLAALIDVAWSLRLAERLEDGGAYANTNVVGTLNAIQFAARCNARMLMMSSSEVYGTPETVPIKEADRLHPQSPYAASKCLCEAMCEEHICDGHEIVIARPFNTYGPGQSTRAVLGKITRHAALADDGAVLSLGNPTTRRDWVYVEDTVDGLIRIMQMARRGSTYNLGTGRAVAVEDAVAMCGIKDVRWWTGQDRGAHEVLILQADATRARKDLGWEPKVSLEDGLRRTMESYITR